MFDDKSSQAWQCDRQQVTDGPTCSFTAFSGGVSGIFRRSSMLILFATRVLPCCTSMTDRIKSMSHIAEWSNIAHVMLNCDTLNESRVYAGGMMIVSASK